MVTTFIHFSALLNSICLLVVYMSLFIVNCESIHNAPEFTIKMMKIVKDADFSYVAISMKIFRDYTASYTLVTSPSRT